MSAVPPSTVMTTLPFAPLTWEGLRWQEDAAARRIANRVVVAA